VWDNDAFLFPRIPSHQSKQLCDTALWLCSPWAQREGLAETYKTYMEGDNLLEERSCLGNKVAARRRVVENKEKNKSLPWPYPCSQTSRLGFPREGEKHELSTSVQNYHTVDMIRLLPCLPSPPINATVLSLYLNSHRARVPCEHSDDFPQTVTQARHVAHTSPRHQTRACVT